MKKSHLAIVLASFPTLTTAEFYTESDAHIFQPSSTYRCRTEQTFKKNLSDRAEWQHQNSGIGGSNEHLPIILGFDFHDSLETGGMLDIEAIGGVVDGIAKYRVAIEGRSTRGDDAILFRGAFGEGYIAANRSSAGIEHPVMVSWKDIDGRNYYTAHLYCAFLAPND